jgi:superfamily II DNA helicase RecQ
VATAGIPCEAYHAGLKADKRSKVLADWTAGVLPVVAATIAFGMGIDKTGTESSQKR